MASFLSGWPVSSVPALFPWALPVSLSIEASGQCLWLEKGQSAATSFLVCSPLLQPLSQATCCGSRVKVIRGKGTKDGGQ